MGSLNKLSICLYFEFLVSLNNFKSFQFLILGMSLIPNKFAPSARAQAALLMRWAKGKHTTAEIARALNTSWPTMARLEDPHH